MTGQEARDDEREALIAARRALAQGELNAELGVAVSWAEVRALHHVIRALVKALERKHPEPAITEALVERCAIAACIVAEDGPWDYLLDTQQEEWRDTARVVLEAALRVPVGERDVSR